VGAGASPDSWPGLCFILGVGPTNQGPLQSEAAMLWRVVFFALSIVVVVAHVTGQLKPLMGFFDIGIEYQHLPYLLAIPFVCVVGLVMLKDER
jgi:hypothetical protein